MRSTIVATLKRIFARSELTINEHQVKMVTDEKGIGVIQMDPMDFLELAR